MSTNRRINHLADEYETTDAEGRTAIITSCSLEDAGPLADELRRRAVSVIAAANKLRRRARLRENGPPGGGIPDDALHAAEVAP